MSIETATEKRVPAAVTRPRIEDALRRETRQKLGVELASIRPLFFKDAELDKRFGDGTRRRLHMVFLIYQCTIASLNLVIDEKFSESSWFSSTDLAHLPLNDLTRDTLSRGGFVPVSS